MFIIFNYYYLIIEDRMIVAQFGGLTKVIFSTGVNLFKNPGVLP